MLTSPIFLHRNDLYSWVTDALIKSRGTFYYRGVWMGGAYGILTADPSNIEYMVKTNFKNFPKGKYYRERFQDLLGDGIFNADGELWKEQRRRAKSHIHSSRFIEHSLQTTRDLIHQKLFGLTEKLVKSGDRFDLQEVLLRFSLENICIAAMGIDLGCLEIDFPEVPFAKAFEETTELSLFRFLLPPFVWKPMKLFGIGYERRLAAAVQIVKDFADKTVSDRRHKLARRGKLADQSDLLSRIMDDQDNYNNDFEDNFYRDFCISFILAGRDTTSVALAWFFYVIHKNPEVEAKIVIEMNEILAHKKGKIQDNLLFTVEELKRMVYLQAALTEALRLYQSVPIEMKQAQEDDVFPDGNLVKKGARVLYCIYSMSHQNN